MVLSACENPNCKNPMCVAAQHDLSGDMGSPPGVPEPTHMDVPPRPSQYPGEKPEGVTFVQNVSGDVDTEAIVKRTQQLLNRPRNTFADPDLYDVDLSCYKLTDEQVERLRTFLFTDLGRADFSVTYNRST